MAGSHSTPLRFPSFLKGVARVVTLTGKLDVYRMQTDVDALKNDWKTTGEDVRAAITDYNEHSKK